MSMKLKEFMEMLKEAAAYTKEGKSQQNAIAATSCSPSYGDGITCQLCLTADGDVSSEPTSISIRFEVEGSK